MQSSWTDMILCCQNAAKVWWNLFYFLGGSNIRPFYILLVLSRISPWLTWIRCVQWHTRHCGLCCGHWQRLWLLRSWFSCFSIIVHQLCVCCLMVTGDHCVIVSYTNFGGDFSNFKGYKSIDRSLSFLFLFVLYFFALIFIKMICILLKIFSGEFLIRIELTFLIQLSTAIDVVSLVLCIIMWGPCVFCG